MTTKPDYEELERRLQDLEREVARHRSVEDELRRAEEKYRRFFEDDLTGDFLTDADGIILECNPAFLRIFGYQDKSEVLGQSITTLYPDPSERASILRELVAKGRLERYETTRKRKDGSLITIDENIVATFDRNGKLLEVKGQIYDVTAHRRSTEALHRSEERYRALFESIDEGFCIIEVIFDENGKGIDHRFLETNPAFERHTGLVSAVGKTARELVPDLEERWPETFGRIATTGKREQFVDVSAAMGRWFEVDCFRIGDPEERKVAVLFDDITERKKAEDLRQFRSLLLSSVQDAIIAHDDRLRISYWGKGAEEIFGWREDEVLGEDSYELLRTRIPGSTREKGVQQLLESGSYEGEAFYRHKAGHEILVHVKSGVLRGHDGSFKGLVTSMRDITERKRMEESIRRSRDELEVRVRERTAELERKNQELQEFAFVASHDLSEPLRKIQAFGSLLEARGLDHFSEKEKDYISRMVGAANRMQELLQALLGYSRIATKGEEFSLTKLDDVVRDAISDLEFSINEIEARVETSHLPTVVGDPNQLRQLFQNLVANALKYHRSDVKTVIRIYGEKEDGSASIFVEDNGIGFDEQYLEKIFQPFQRLHGRHEYPGIGMGLAICKKIVERHGGTITAKSSGNGSTFIVRLPVNHERIKSQPVPVAARMRVGEMDPQPSSIESCR